MLDKFYAETSEVALIIISIALMLFLGFAMTRLTKLLKLPNVTAYILVGILIGPFCLDLIPSKVIHGMDFITDIALAFIAFSVGQFFRISTLKKNGMKVIVITLFEALLASVLIFVLFYFILHIHLAFSIVLAALASATAPASTIMTIRQTKAKGDFVDTLLQVVALDDVVSLIAYSIAISVALASMSGFSNVDFSVIGVPILKNIGALILGCAFGFLLKLLMPTKRSTDNRLIISLATLFLFCGICAMLDVSPLLGCMSMGMVYINLTEDDKLFKQLNYFSPPILLLFFVLSGLNFKLDALFSGKSSFTSIPLIVIGILYVITRVLGKYLGAFLGCMTVKKPKEVRNYLGLGLVPQAGVAIGLAALGARMIGGDMGEELQTVILASSVLYEMVGPACSKLALYLSHSYTTDINELVNVDAVHQDGTQKSGVEVLIEQIQTIQKQLPQHPTISEEEAAFNQAIEEQNEAYRNHYPRFGRRR